MGVWWDLYEKYEKELEDAEFWKDKKEPEKVPEEEEAPIVDL